MLSLLFNSEKCLCFRMSQLLPTRKVGVCCTLLVAYTYLVMVMIRSPARPYEYYETVKQAPLQSNNDSYITDCITKRILGRIPDDMVTQLFDGEKIGESAETHQQRQESFRQVFNKREWGDKIDKEYQGIQSSGKKETVRMWINPYISVIFVMIYR